MKNTYIKYKNCQYPTNDCQFWSDCVVYFDGDRDELIIPNGEWTYHEEDIVVESKTFKQFQDEVDLQDKLIEEAENAFSEENGGDPDFELISVEEAKLYFKKCQEYIEAYLKAHTPHQISFPADTSR